VRKAPFEDRGGRRRIGRETVEGMGGSLGERQIVVESGRGGSIEINEMESISQ